MPTLGRVALTATAECAWMRLLFDRARGVSSYVITGDHERNWLLAEAAGAPDSFTFSLPSHIILAEFIHQLRRYGNADQINRWLAQFERDNASLMIKIAQTITFTAHIYFKVPGGAWELYV